MIYSPGSCCNSSIWQWVKNVQLYSFIGYFNCLSLPLTFANTEHWPELGLSHRKLLLQKPNNIWDTWCNKKITNGTCILSRHGLLKTHQTVILHTWFLTSILLVCIMERSYHNNNTFCHGNICSMKSIIHLFFLSILVKSNHSKCFSL